MCEERLIVFLAACLVLSPPFGCTQFSKLIATESPSYNLVAPRRGIVSREKVIPLWRDEAASWLI